MTVPATAATTTATTPTTTTPTTTTGTSQHNASSLLKDLQATSTAVQNKDWLAAGLGAVNTAMDILGSASNPLSAIMSAGFGWAIEHISFLKEPFDALLGNPSSVTGTSSSWTQAASSIGTLASTYKQASTTETQNWLGTAANAYRSTATQHSDAVAAVGQASSTVSSAVSGAGDIVAQVRKVVLDLITEAVQKIIQQIIQALASSWATFGASIAAAVVQIVQTATQYAQKIAGNMQKLASSMQSLLSMVQKVMQAVQAVKQVITQITGNSAATTSTTQPTTQQLGLTSTGLSQMDAGSLAQYTNTITNPTLLGTAVGSAVSAAPTSASGVTGPVLQPGPAVDPVTGIPVVQADSTMPTLASTNTGATTVSSAPTLSGTTGSPTLTSGATGASPVAAAPTVNSGAGTPTLAQATTPATPAAPAPQPAADPRFGPSGPPPSAGTSATNIQVRQWISQAQTVLRANGVADADMNTDDIARLIQHESSNNPNAINLWDSNARANHPSKGLMQTIDSTFDQYHVDGYNSIYSPVDNIVAGVRYSVDRYGSVSDVPGVAALRNGHAYRGY